jgi:hypothetical protein
MNKPVKLTPQRKGRLAGRHHPDARRKLRRTTYMSRAATSVVLAAAAAVLGSSVTAAIAETKWERNHPRRDQVNDRLANQNRRINQERKEGEISKAQANRLHQEDHAIRQEERTMSKLNGGHITPAEQKALNQQENAVSRQIGQ